MGNVTFFVPAQHFTGQSHVSNGTLGLRIV
jgi:hypothetical protein